ncbi:MAG: ABC transporter substrate-binding protein [Rubrivivax sp.]|nr:ABC transporter substrate-binding protein [Rubrivivax sp.]
MFRILKGVLAGWLMAAMAVMAAAAEGPPIVVHHIGPLTGVLAGSNGEALAGARLYLDHLNARGGIAGRPVRMDALDDAQDAKIAASLFAQLVAERKLLALMMPRTTPSMESMMPGVLKHGIPVIGPQTGASFVNQPPKREIFTLRASYQREAERAIHQQHSIGVRTFGMLLADDAFGRDTMVGIQRAMTELKIEPVAIARIDNRKPDVTEAVRALVAKRPEVVMLIVSSKAAADFIKGYRAQGGIATFISLSNTSNNEYIKGLGDNARGAIVMQVMPSPFSAVTPLAREYAAAAAKNKAALSYAGFYGFATAKLLALGLAKAGREPTPGSLVQAMEDLGEVDLGGFRLRYGPGERTGSGYVDSTIITHQGRFMR